ncbi:SCO6880 family protein [Williamsia sterculiae]|uniref:Type VII secretion protein EccE n=1 Tax=Williamsia sterculiae TaxID=1344003 RepID=A0A1N7HEK1_9NOCA|nr:SCO6880 family protein [Williamsia sterculiae]SIS23262.1 hypothetical protein SAMN05445060_4085 [Williamsia sterculiae]
MTATSGVEKNAILLFGRWSKPRSTGLFGQTWGVTVLGGVLLLVWVILVSITQSLWVGGSAFLIESGLLVPLVWHREGVTGLEWMVRRVQYRWAFWRKETDFSGGVFGKTPGFGMPPGILGNVEQYEYELRNGDRWGMNHLRAKDHFAVVLDVTPRGQEGFDQWQANQWVAGHGDLLARLGTTNGAIGMTVTVESVPEFGQRVKAEARRIHSPAAPEFALEHLASTVTDRSGGTVRAEVRVCFIFIRPRGAKTVLDVAKQIGSQLSTLIAATKKAGVDAVPMTGGEISMLVARAYRPELTAAIEGLTQQGRTDVIAWDQAGPRGARNNWDHYLHNGFRSVTWEMATPPESAVPSDNLKPLLIPRATLPCKRVTVVYRIHRAGEAKKMVNADFREALADEQSKSGVASASATIRRENTQAARVEQAHGAGLTRFGMLVTLTTPKDDDLAEITPELEGLGDEASIMLQRCWGDSDAAFAGGIGVGILLPEYASGHLAVFE